MGWGGRETPFLFFFLVTLSGAPCPCLSGYELQMQLEPPCAPPGCVCLSRLCLRCPPRANLNLMFIILMSVFIPSQHGQGNGHTGCGVVMLYAGCDPAVMIKEFHLHVSMWVNLRSPWLSKTYASFFLNVYFVYVQNRRILQDLGTQTVFDFDKMSVCYTFFFFLPFADLCCKCSFTRMPWFWIL